MKVLEIELDKIKPYDKNPRINGEAIKYVSNSIKEFGFKNPIILDKNNVIIAGHTRYSACKKLKLDKAPCIIADDLTEKQARAFRLADNKTAEFAKWDEDLLNFELGELDDFKMDDFGFDLENILDDEQEIEEDEPPEINKEAVTQVGDIYKLGRHRLMCGDSTNEEDIEKLLDYKKIDLLFTDPPYGINVVGDDGNVGGATFGISKKGKYSKIIADDTTDTAKAMYEILKPLVNKMIIWGGNYFINFLDFSDGWLVWDKRCESGIRNTFSDGELAYCNFHTPLRIYRQLWNGMIREGEHDKRVHPTQKPIKILTDILTDFSTENDVVLDVFGGSGSTLIACEHLNRQCYMMELDPKYVDVIIKRWENLTGKKAEKI